MTDWTLVVARRFGPILGIQVAAGFANNFLKTATVVAITFSFYPEDGGRASMVAAMAVAASALPGFLFASLAGQVGERMDKARLARIIRGLDVLLMVGVLLALTSRMTSALLVTIFLAGVRSTFYSPLKYSMLPFLLERRLLLFATGLLQASIIAAAFAGQVAGGLFDPSEAGLVLLGAAILCFFLSLLIPPVPSECPELRLNWNIWRGTMELLQAAFERPVLRSAIIGISLIDALGALLLSQFPPLVRHTLSGTSAVVSMFFGAFALGAILGGVTVNRLLKSEISSHLAPWLLMVMGLATAMLWLLVTSWTPAVVPDGLAEFLVRPVALVMLGLASAIAAMAAMIVVPLFAILQTGGPSHERNRCIAANNIANAGAVLMLMGLVGVAVRFGLLPIHILFVAGFGMVATGVLLAHRGRSSASVIVRR